MHFVHDVTSCVKYETTVLRLLTVSTLNMEAADMFTRNNKARMAYKQALYASGPIMHVWMYCETRRNVVLRGEDWGSYDVLKRNMIYHAEI
jgi:hypothetical protein